MALALPAPAGGGPSTSGKRRAWTLPSCGVPHSGRRGDRNRIMGPPGWPLGPDQGPAKRRLRPENMRGSDDTPTAPGRPTDRLVGTCPALAALRAQLQHLAAFDTLGNPAVQTVLLLGETGTGKGLVARVLDASGTRGRGPSSMSTAQPSQRCCWRQNVWCHAGAFTDAKRAKPGLFEAACGGTLFLDEIDALPLAIQGKLLTAIEAKRVGRVGVVREQAVMSAFEALYPERLAEQVERLADHVFRGPYGRRRLPTSGRLARKPSPTRPTGKPWRFWNRRSRPCPHLPPTPKTCEEAIDIRIALRSPLHALGAHSTPLPLARSGNSGRGSRPAPQSAR